MEMEIKCPYCGSGDVRKMVGDWYVCNDCLAEFSVDEMREVYMEVKPHSSASEEYLQFVFENIVDAYHDKNRDELIKWIAVWNRARGTVVLPKWMDRYVQKVERELFVERWW